MKFVDDELEPVEGGPRSRLALMIEELQAQPGRWAEVDRYALERRASAYSRGSQTRKRADQLGAALEYAVKRVGDEFILYFRVAP